MTSITRHQTNDCNRQISITADERDPANGNASHRYTIETPKGVTVLEFQNGPIKETGVNGLTQEALLAILIDRLEGFQSGQYACIENRDALVYCTAALEALNYRTRKRETRGVEGTHEV